MTNIRNLSPNVAFFYKDCFFSCLFIIIDYFGQPAVHYLSGETLLFQENEYSLLGGSAAVYVHTSRQALLSQMQIRQHPLVYGDKIIAQIRMALDKGMLVVVKVDCFYESLRPELYRKKHLDHSLLVLDYNEANDSFTVMEHHNPDSLLYERQTIFSSELRTCMEMYLANYSMLDEPVAFGFFHDIGHSPLSQKECGKIYTKAIGDSLQYHEASYNALKKTLTNGQAGKDWRKSRRN